MSCLVSFNQRLRIPSSCLSTWSALPAPWQQRQQPAIRFVDPYAQDICRPQVTSARAGTLEPVNRAVALGNPFISESRFLEMPVHVAGEHEHTVLHPLRPLAEDAPAVMRGRAPVEIESVPVEAPCPYAKLPRTLMSYQ